MKSKKKTWTEKLNDSKSFPKILEFDRKFPCGKALEKWGAKQKDSVVIAPALEVDAIMRDVTKGKLITIYEICAMLAKKHHVKFCCSLTTGIFITIAAHAAEEAKQNGEKTITPYWRTIKALGVLNPKFPGGDIAQKKLLEDEGFIIIKKGKNYAVKDFEQYLM